jgi:hypothetical protein
MTDALDDVLERLAKKGPEFGPGLSNHGPMAAEALVALGRTEVIESWAEWYAARLSDRPEARNPIAPDGWREALGDIGRAGDWSSFFVRTLDEGPWRDALAVWAPRLLPGIMAGATHGVLRTAHAVRSLERDETLQRIAELGEGLAYWAARYQELPSAPPRSGSLRIADALPRVALVGESHRTRGMIYDAVKAVDTTDFAPIVNLVDLNVDAGAFVSDVTRAFVRQYLGNASHAAIAFVHTVTAPSALRTLAPYLDGETASAAMRYMWQACAAIYAAYARAGAGLKQPVEGINIDRDDLIDEAVAARDEHAIKFTEACLREHEISRDPAFLLAASDAVRRLRAPA